jgi:hypothetical protein
MGERAPSFATFFKINFPPRCRGKGNKKFFFFTEGSLKKNKKNSSSSGTFRKEIKNEKDPFAEVVAV